MCFIIHRNKIKRIKRIIAKYESFIRKIVNKLSKKFNYLLFLHYLKMRDGL